MLLTPRTREPGESIAGLPLSNNVGISPKTTDPRKVFGGNARSACADAVSASRPATATNAASAQRIMVFIQRLFEVERGTSLPWAPWRVASNAPLSARSSAMFGIAGYPAFVAAVIVFLMIPGPGNLALITSTGKGGLRGSVACTFGVIAGDQVLMWLAVAGVAALLSAYPTAFHAVQWLGAGYLAWLGARMLLA